MTKPNEGRKHKCHLHEAPQPAGSGTLPEPVVTNTVSPQTTRNGFSAVRRPAPRSAGDPGYNHTRMDQTICKVLSGFLRDSSNAEQHESEEGHVNGFC